METEQIYYHVYWECTLSIAVIIVAGGIDYFADCLAVLLTCRLTD